MSACRCHDKEAPGHDTGPVMIISVAPDVEHEVEGCLHMAMVVLDCWTETPYPPTEFIVIGTDGETVAEGTWGPVFKHVQYEAREKERLRDEERNRRPLLKVEITKPGVPVIRFTTRTSAQFFRDEYEPFGFTVKTEVLTRKAPAGSTSPVSVPMVPTDSLGNAG